MKYKALIILANVAIICFTVKEFHLMMEELMAKKIHFEVLIKD